MHSGNMGLGHRFGELLEAAERMGSEEPVWAFCGRGARRGKVEVFAPANTATRIQLYPYVAREGPWGRRSRRRTCTS